MRILIDARGIAACALLPVITAGAVFAVSPASTSYPPSAAVPDVAEEPTMGEVPAAAAFPTEPAVGSAPSARVALTWWPERPVQGRLFVVRVAAPAGEDGPAGTFSAEGGAAGEPLHFAPAAAGGLESLAPVPVGEQEHVEVVVAVRHASGALDSLRASVPVAAGDYRHERLTVAPRFGRAPDEAQRARLERDRAKAREVSRLAHETPRLWRDAPVMPRESRVTSGFGNGRVFNGQVSSRHMGLDLSGDPGEEVRAAARGVVALVDEFLLAGNIVYVNHGGGLISGYFHLSEQLVAEGDTVEAGTPIGRVGATGRVTGPHLHWVVRYGYTSVDPRSLLAVAEAAVAAAVEDPSGGSARR